MANNLSTYNPDDWQAQVRQQVLQQMGEPSVTATPAAEPDTTSPDFAGSPSFAGTSFADSYANPDNGGSPAAQDSGYAPAAAAPTTNPFDPANQPGPQGVGSPGNATNAIAGFYGKYLGRPASADEVSAWLNGQFSGNLSAIENAIANSPEADAYNRTHQLGNYQPQTPASPATTAATTPGAPALPAPANAFGVTNGYATPPADTTWRDSIRQIILNRLNADQNPVDENAPAILAAVNAAKDQATRQNTQERNDLAERLYAQGGGLNTNAITNQIQQSNERTGTALGSLKAQLLYSAYKDRATELNHLLDLATQAGDTEAARQIQVTLANLQAALAREGLGVNLAEFGAQLNQNAALAGLNG